MYAPHTLRNLAPFLNSKYFVDSTLSFEFMLCCKNAYVCYAYTAQPCVAPKLKILRGILKNCFVMKITTTALNHYPVVPSARHPFACEGELTTKDDVLVLCHKAFFAARSILC
jgi:hypothetical protein